MPRYLIFSRMCNAEEVDLSHLKNHDRIIAYLEAFVLEGLTVSGLVNKLSSFVLALTWHLETSKANDTTPLSRLKDYKIKKTAEKTKKKKESRVSNNCCLCDIFKPFSIFSVRNLEEPENKRCPFSEEETMEIKTHFNLSETRKTPSQSEIENFLGRSKFYIGRTECSIKNKIYYILKKLEASNDSDSDSNSD